MKTGIGMFLCALLAGTACAAVPSAIAPLAAGVVYENDFSLRRSSAGVPTTRWQRQGYVDGDLFWWRHDESISRSTEMQDGWYKALDNSDAWESRFVRGAFGGDDASLNRCAMFVASHPDVVNPAVDHRTFAFQSFGSVLTNGILRLQADLRAAKYNSVGNSNFFIGPLYEAYLNFRWNASLPKYAGFVGFNLAQRENKVRTYYYGGDGQGGGYNGDFMSVVTIGNWYRFVVDFDLDRNEFSGSVYAMGAAQPDVDAPDGTPVDTIPVTRFYYDADAKTGGFAGIVLRDCGSVSMGHMAEPERTPAADNIRLWWRAEGTAFTDGDLFYVNDFTERRSRAPSTASRAACSFVTERTLVEDRFAGYAVNEIDGLPGQSLLCQTTWRKEPQPYGIDGWRRLNCDGFLAYSVVRHPLDSKNRMVAVTGDFKDVNRFGLAAQNLGCRITSGQVLFQFDIRTPDKLRATNTPNLYGMLAPERYLDSGTDAEQASLYAGRSGLLGENGSTAFSFATQGADGVVSEAGAQAGRWYRVKQVVDLETKTFDTEIYDLGDSPVAGDAALAGDPVHARRGVACRNPEISDISCFAFFMGGAGGETGSGSISANEAGIIYLDNLRVMMRAADGADWQNVYLNDFTTRVRYGVPKDFLPLAACADAPGVDGWVMRNWTYGRPAVFGGMNPALGLEASNGGDYLWAVQPIGDSLSSGKVRFRADIKPPRAWSTQHGDNTCASLMLGTDALYMGNRHAGLPDFLTQFQIRFGLAPKKRDAAYNRYVDCRAFYYDGTGARVFFTDGGQEIDWTHWYRFEAESNVRKGTFCVKVYDMGTVHPDLSTPMPKEVFARADNVAYRTPLVAGEGFSTLCAAILGNEKETPWEEIDSGLAYIDNIQISRVPQESLIIIR